MISLGQVIGIEFDVPTVCDDGREEMRTITLYQKLDATHRPYGTPYELVDGEIVNRPNWRVVPSKVGYLVKVREED